MSERKPPQEPTRIDPDPTKVSHSVNSPKPRGDYETSSNLFVNFLLPCMLNLMIPIFTKMVLDTLYNPDLDYLDLKDLFWICFAGSILLRIRAMNTKRRSSYKPPARPAPPPLCRDQKHGRVLDDVAQPDDEQQSWEKRSPAIVNLFSSLCCSTGASLIASDVIRNLWEATIDLTKGFPRGSLFWKVAAETLAAPTIFYAIAYWLSFSIWSEPLDDALLLFSGGWSQDNSGTQEEEFGACVDGEANHASTTSSTERLNRSTGGEEPSDIQSLSRPPSQLWRQHLSSSRLARQVWYLHRASNQLFWLGSAIHAVFTYYTSRDNEKGTVLALSAYTPPALYMLIRAIFLLRPNLSECRPFPEPRFLFGSNTDVLAPDIQAWEAKMQSRLHFLRACVSLLTIYIPGFLLVRVVGELQRSDEILSFNDAALLAAIFLGALTLVPRVFSLELRAFLWGGI
ncbi:hypothetical protein BJ875DRAFT_440427 [Amylocarpus encephaloides]|uniref:Uncharacterized protein n=1 Tax=Amylocarpus encephaloides TaxID=45428 RepID=A0A9P7YKN9_9HELO|nr:hypothetical protein BJ875DRAFT_440427 [Amylocarpus encephaloides]